jgi:tRNA U34 5-methylaminomethyl-2-thiouridine-forming methyltransferase MnmC
MAAPLSAPQPGFVPPTDLAVLPTRDGTRTLYSAQLDERYHSVHGAVSESLHVFVERGFRAVPATPLRILEVGLGTGLNLLLTWAEALRTGRTVHYTALEPFPVPPGTVEALDHPGAIGRPELADAFLTMMRTPPGSTHAGSSTFHFRPLGTALLDLPDERAFDLVYFDAFGPATQPGMWTAEVFRHTLKAMVPGGVLVTYCAKGAVRRTLLEVGFIVERLPGPPGKREMLRVRRPL